MYRTLFCDQLYSCSISSLPSRGVSWVLSAPSLASTPSLSRMWWFREFNAENLWDCKGFPEDYSSVSLDLCISSLQIHRSTGINARESVPVPAAPNCFIGFKLLISLCFKKRFDTWEGLWRGCEQLQTSIAEGEAEGDRDELEGFDL